MEFNTDNFAKISLKALKAVGKGALASVVILLLINLKVKHRREEGGEGNNFMGAAVRFHGQLGSEILLLFHLID